VRLQGGLPGPWTYAAVTVAVTGTWGYATTVPTTIKAVCRILAARLYNWEKNKYGNEGGVNANGASFTQSPRPVLDENLKQMLDPYRLKHGMGTIDLKEPARWTSVLP
jgi:hypothetical protein